MGMGVSVGINYCWGIDEQEWVSLQGELDYWEHEISISELMNEAFAELQAKAQEVLPEGEYSDFWRNINIHTLNTEEEHEILEVSVVGGFGCGEGIGLLEPEDLIEKEKRFLEDDNEWKEHLLYILNAPIRPLNVLTNAERKSHIEGFDEDINSYADEEEKEKFRKEHLEDNEEWNPLLKLFTAEDLPKFLKWRVVGDIS